MMNRSFKTAIALSALALAAGAPAAHAQKAADCTAILVARGIPVASHTPDPCADLAIMVAATSAATNSLAATILKDDERTVAAAFSPRDLQPQQPQQPALSGTPAQGHAIPGVQPAGVAAGTIAAVGTEAGDAAIAALGFNPAILFLGDAVSKEMSQFSRFADLTVFVPVSNLSSEDDGGEQEDDGPEYFGARLRLNFTGISSGSRVWDRARDLARQWILDQARNADRVREVLAQAPNLNGCVTELMKAAPAEAVVQQNCGTTVSLVMNEAQALELQRELTHVRRAADARYFGADIRYDHGDPTMGAVENASGSFLFAGFAFGQRIGAGTSTAANHGVRARLGVRHATLDHSDDGGEFALEGGLGLEMARQFERQEINASLGLEFRQGGADEESENEIQTNYGMVRGSFLVPITAGNSLSINVGTPVWGDVSPVLSVNFNWGLLLPGRPGR
jgi:hypothetical protein